MPPKPPHPIDRNRLQRYVSSERVCHAISAAYSTDMNQRNLECDYYPAYNHTLSELADFEFDGALTVREQYDLWLSKATLNLRQLLPEAFDAANGVADEPMPAAIPPAVAALPPPPPPAAAAAPAAPVEAAPARYWDVPSGPRISKPPPRLLIDYITSDSVRKALYGKPSLTEKEQVRAIEHLLSLQDMVDAELADATVADTSTTTIDTVPDNQGRDGYPDLMLCHTHTVAIPQPDDRKKLFGWNRRMQRKVVHHCFPLILEVKACIDRTMQDEKWRTRASDALKLAEEELYEYLQTCFMRDLSAHSVIAMSAAGPYWRWIRVKREQIGLETLMIDSDKLQAMLRRFRAAKIFTLGTKESDDEFTRLRDKGLIPIIETHYWYKSTMVPNPQR